MLILIWWIKLDENKVIIGKGFLHTLFHEDPCFAYPHFLNFFPNPYFLLTDIVNLHKLSLGTISVPESPCCVFYATRRQ